MTVTTSINASMTISMQSNKSQNLGDPTAGVVSQQQNLGTISSSWAPNSTPNGKDSWSGSVVMSSGTATIDLTSLTQLGLSTAVDMTGLKLRAIKFLAPVGNAATVEIQPGASNGYSSVGIVSAIAPGDGGARTALAATAVSPTNKTITVTGTGADSVELLMIFGS